MSILQNSAAKAELDFVIKSKSVTSPDFETELFLLEHVALPQLKGSNELTTGGSCTSHLQKSASGGPCCCHSPQLNVFTLWLSRAGLLWQVGAVGWLKD